MKVEDLKVMLQYAKDSDDVMITVSLPYSTVGAIPMVKVKSASSGFDWEHGKFMIHPDEKLTISSNKLNEQFKKVEKRASELFIKNMELEKEVRRLKDALASQTRS